jgi:hypothetical protein
MIKKQIPLIVAFVMGILFIIQFFVPHKISQDFLTGTNKWIIIIGSISMLLGIGSLIHFHYTHIKRGAPGWGFSVVLFLSFGLAITAGFLPSIIMWFRPAATPDAAPEKWLGFIVLIPGLNEGSPLFWIFRNAISPFMATMFSLIGFFIASAAFRAFRARSAEATLLLIAAVIIMLGQTALGAWIWGRIPDIMVWIFSVPNMAAKRAILFGIAMGSVAFSLRIILGIERNYLGGTDKK